MFEAREISNGPDAAHIRSLNAAKRRWRWLRTSLFDSYQPELHYMRGPGPRCRERDNGSAWP